jgi:hypothetical protein
MTTFSWTIRRMYAAPVVEGYTDVVVVANWLCVASDGAKTAQTFGNASFPKPVDSFIPYGDLTEQQVLEWCWDNGVNKDETEELLLNKLVQQTSPSVLPMQLPW